MRSTLFRPEALESQRDRQLGDASLARPPGLGLLTAVAVVATVGIVLFGCLAGYTRKARVPGYLVPTQGLIKVVAPQAGTLAERLVEEGRRVRRGETLFVLTTERASLVEHETEAAAITRLRGRRASLGDDAARQLTLAGIAQRDLAARARGITDELAQLQSAIQTQRERLDGSRATVERYEELVRRQFVAQAALVQHRDQVLEQTARLQALQRSRSALQRELGTLEAEILAQPARADAARAALAREISTVEQQLAEHESRRGVVVTAPADGVVTAVLAERGQVTAPAAPLLTIIPDGSALQAHLFVPSRAIGFIASGQPVSLRYQAFPFQRFGSARGEVAAIARAPEMPGEVSLPLTLSEPSYRVTVTLDRQSMNAYGREFALRAGMQLDADIALDRRRLIEWLFDPVLAFRGRT